MREVEEEEDRLPGRRLRNDPIKIDHVQYEIKWSFINHDRIDSI